MSQKRLYVMDFESFIKIGVSGNVEVRRNQIPYKVKQYYCTEPLPNAFKVERIAHNAFKKYRAQNTKGREYFNICFDEACEYVRFLIAIYFGINLREIFISIFSQLSEESRKMSIVYMMALANKEGISTQDIQL